MNHETSLDGTLVSRRILLCGAAGLGVAAAIAPLLAACGDDNDRVRAESPTETPTIRIPKEALTYAIATAMAANFLREEGFTDVQYVNLPRPHGMATVHRDSHEVPGRDQAGPARLSQRRRCRRQPERAAQAFKTHGFIPDALYDSTLAEVPKIPHNVWRTHDPADSMRFYGLRLKEAGLIKATPDEIIAKGADFRFLRELRKELKEAL